MDMLPVIRRKSLSGNPTREDMEDLVRQFRDGLSRVGITVGATSVNAPSWWPGSICSLGCTEHVVRLVGIIPLVRFGVRGVDVIFWVHRTWRGRWEVAADYLVASPPRSDQPLAADEAATLDVIEAAGVVANRLLG